ncbi:MAG: hypothetical protein ACRC3J_05515 [Culicoidibacterales bacterium]
MNKSLYVHDNPNTKLAESILNCKPSEASIIQEEQLKVKRVVDSVAKFAKTLTEDGMKELKAAIRIM